MKEMMMKTILATLLTCAFTLSGCAPRQTAMSPPEQMDEDQIVAFCMSAISARNSEIAKFNQGLANAAASNRSSFLHQAQLKSKKKPIDPDDLELDSIHIEKQPSGTGDQSDVEIVVSFIGKSSRKRSRDKLYFLATDIRFQPGLPPEQARFGTRQVGKTVKQKTEEDIEQDL